MWVLQPTSREHRAALTRGCRNHISWRSAQSRSIPSTNHNPDAAFLQLLPMSSIIITMTRSDEAEWWFNAVYEAVQEIPVGKVTSYAHIARLLGQRKCMLTARPS